MENGTLQILNYKRKKGRKSSFYLLVDLIRKKLHYDRKLNRGTMLS
jgi:hypothetical protein